MAIKREYKQEGGITFLKCRKCGKRLTLDCYNKDASKHLGIRSDCRDCTKNWLRNNYKNNKDKYTEYKKKYAITHKEEIVERKRLYRQANKEQIAAHKKEYYMENRDFVNSRIEERRRKHNDELGFNWTSFHERASRFVRKNGLRPKECPICGSVNHIEMHHPSYESYEKWSEVVFCCRGCHQRIHAGHIQSPEPINLLDLKTEGVF